MYLKVCRYLIRADMYKGIKVILKADKITYWRTEHKLDYDE